MKNKFLIPLMLLVAVLFGGLGWWLDSDLPEEQPAALDGTALGATAAPIQGQELSPATSATAREDARNQGEGQPARVSMEANSAEFAIPSDAIWITGRVIYPEGMPNDVGVVTVTARGRTLGESSRREYETQVDRHGEFRVAFAADTRTGWLEANSRYLYTPEKLSINPGKLTEPVVLEPEMGGIIKGVARAPLGEEWDEQALDGAIVSVRSWIGRTAHERRARIDGDGHYELLAVPPSHYKPSFRAPLWVDHREEKVSMRSGETLLVNVQFERGSAVSGRVVDEHGIGRVGVSVEMSEAESAWTREFVLTDEEGAFQLLGVKEGDFVIKAGAQEKLVTEKQLGFIPAGSIREGIELVLRSGNSLEGVVRWADGSPAVGAWVSVSQERETSGLTFSFDDSISGKTGPDGSFEISGLESSLCAVRVTAKSFREADIAKAKAREAAGKKPRLRARGPTYRVRKLDVPPGTSGLELILTPGDSITGRVLDDQGEGLKAFLIQATPDGDDLMGKDVVRNMVLTADGRFSVDGLSPGGWTVRAIADDHEPSQELSVILPGSGELEFQANRLAQLSGVVRDPSGEPLSGAGIWIDKLGDDEDVLANVIARSWGEQATSNRDGKFKAHDVAPGRLRVWANMDGFGVSEGVILQVEPGSQVEQVVLQLRLPGRIRGRLHGSIADLEGRKITARMTDGGRTKSATTDASGDFDFEGLDAGAYSLRLATSRTAAKSLEREIVEEVEVSEGGEVTVVLGSPPANPVTVQGFVLENGEPAVGVPIRCRAIQGGSGNNDVARTGADGEYFMTLREPGDFDFTLGDQVTGAISRSRRLSPGGNTGVSFDLPGSTLAGVVLGLGGDGYGKCELVLIPTGGEVESSQREQRAWANGDGRFSFKYVAEGTYNLRVGARQVSARRRRRATMTYAGTQVIEGLEVIKGQAPGDLQISLVEEAILRVTVTDPSGTPVKGAHIRVKTPAGESLFNSSYGPTDALGKLLYPGIGMERISVQALNNGKWGPAQSVRTSPGETVEVFLEVSDS